MKGIYLFYDVVFKGFIDCVKVFIEKVMILNVWNVDGYLFFDIVVEMGNFECVELLIRYGVLVEDIRNGFKLRLRIV